MTEVTVDGSFTFIFREICPRDFYWFALVENDYPDLPTQTLSLLIFALLLDEDEYVLDSIPSRYLPPVLQWMMETLITEKVMKVEQWLEFAFHMCKQRWDNTIDWLETQPMSKILLMGRIQTKFVQEQNREMKKGRRGKK